MFSSLVVKLMKIYKRIISLFFAVVICVSMCVTSVLAAWYNDAAYLYSQCGIGQWVAEAIFVSGGAALGSSIGAGAGTVVIPGVGSVEGAAIGNAIGAAAGHTGKEAFDAFMNYLAADSSFVSEEDYIAALDSPVITSSDMSLYLSFYLDTPSEDDLVSALQSGYILDYHVIANSFLYTLGHCSSYSSGSYSFYHPQLVFYTPVFTVAQSDTFKFRLPGDIIGCGYSLASGTWNGGIFMQVQDGDTWSNVGYIKPSFTTTSSSESGMIYTYSSGIYSTTFSLQPGYNYRVKLVSSSSSLSGSGSAAHYGKKLGIETSGISLVSTTETVVAPDASTRSASLMQTINNYNSTTNNYNYFIGTTDANGNVNQVYEPDIFNEQTMIFKEPVTGEQYLCTGWKYSYSTGNRGYWLSLPENSYLYNGQSIRTVVLAYMDDALYVMGFRQDLDVYDSIADMASDAVFLDKYDYVIATAKAENPEACQHVYTSETVTAPTCTAQGVRRYTCELCGVTRDEKIPATGHAWEATETVETELNENGDVTKLGYTVYTCSACGETYKQYDGTGQPGPPGSSGTGDGEDSPGWLSKLFDKFQDIFSPDIDIDVDISGGETAETQESWFARFISKFNWLSSVSDIYKQLVADVTSDANTAAAVSDGVVALSDITSAHAAVSDSGSAQAVSYTAPELAVSFGASDKYGVDWENIKAMDLSWYAPYKKTVDGILSGILWLSYLFLLVKRAPGIIRGSEMVTEDSIKIDLWRSKHDS